MRLRLARLVRLVLRPASDAVLWPPPLAPGAAPDISACLAPNLQWPPPWLKKPGPIGDGTTFIRWVELTWFYKWVKQPEGEILLLPFKVIRDDRFMRGHRVSFHAGTTQQRAAIVTDVWSLSPVSGGIAQGTPPGQNASGPLTLKSDARWSSA